MSTGTRATSGILKAQNGRVSLSQRSASSLIRILWGNVSIVVLVVAWFGWVVIGGVNQVVMPSPMSVAADLFGHPEAYVADLGATAWIAFEGLVLGQILGVALAIAAHLSGVVRAAVRPVVLIVRSVPMVAMVPIFARIVGYGTPTIMVVATLVAYFPAFVLVSQGLAASHASQRDMFAVLGASRWRRFLHLDLAVAVPSMLAAIRVSAVACVVGVLLAEFVVGTAGLGQLFVVSRVSYDMSRSWGAAILATALSLVFFGAASLLTRRLGQVHEDGLLTKGKA